MGGLRSGVNGTPTFLINGVRMQMRLAADNTAERICAEAAPIEVTIQKASAN
jgi:protein-disulfide isomerase